MRRLALAMTVVLGVVGTPALGATTTTAPCDLLTSDELDEVLGVRLEVLFTDDQSICSWAPPPGEPTSLEVTVVHSKLPKKSIEAGKREERRQPGAVVVKGLGDFAIFRTSKTSPAVTSAQLHVFEGNEVITVDVTAEDVPTKRQMRRLGASALERR